MRRLYTLNMFSLVYISILYIHWPAVLYLPRTNLKLDYIFHVLFLLNRLVILSIDIISLWFSEMFVFIMKYVSYSKYLSLLWVLNYCLSNPSFIYNSFFWIYQFLIRKWKYLSESIWIKVKLNQISKLLYFLHKITLQSNRILTLH